MKLGLVCLRHKQGMKKGFTGLKAIQKASRDERYDKLFTATIHNLEQTYSNIKYCVENNILAYRASSEIIPFYEFWDWESYLVILGGLFEIKTYAEKNNIHLIIHPDQFTILNSPDHNIVANSIKILEHHHTLCVHLGIKDMIIHTGGVYGDKDEAMTRFIENYLQLPEYIQESMCLENCHLYNSNDIKLISDLCGVRLCYDLHHSRVIDGELSALTHKLNIARLQPSLCHISSGKKSPTDKSHADYISDNDIKLYKEVFADYPDMIVEVEAKAKELAISKLQCK